MDFDVKEIVTAWFTKATATDSEKARAEARLEICKECDQRIHNDTIGFWYCKECGCPLKGKAFSKRENACPLQKWIPAEIGKFIDEINSKKSRIV